MISKLLKWLKNNYLLGLAVSFSIVLVACSNESNEEYTEEQAISSYIASLQRVDENLPYTYVNGIHKIQNQAGSGIFPVNGDSVYFYYTAYVFKNSAFYIYDTNVKDTARKYGLDTLGRLFIPKAEVLGNKMIKGLNNGLLQIKSQESARLIFTSIYGYGDKPMGIVPANSTLTFDIKMTKVVHP